MLACRTIIDGQADTGIDAEDRGLQYGDGVFRTLKVESGRLCWWKDQYQKLREDCQALGMACPEEALLEKEASQLANQSDVGVVKIIITRGAASRGYRMPDVSRPTRIVMGFPASLVRPDAAQVRWCDLTLAHQPRLAGIKHLNRLENVLARSEWSDPDIAEGLLKDESGHVIGGTMTNVFIVEQGRLITSDLSRCGVAGVARHRILRASSRRGQSIHVEHISQARLLAAEQVLLCNSLVGVWRVMKLDDKVWPDNGWADQLRYWLDEDH